MALNFCVSTQIIKPGFWEIVQRQTQRLLQVGNKVLLFVTICKLNCWSITAVHFCTNMALHYLAITVTK